MPVIPDNSNKQKKFVWTSAACMRARAVARKKSEVAAGRPRFCCEEWFPSQPRRASATFHAAYLTSPDSQ